MSIEPWSPAVRWHETTGAGIGLAGLQWPCQRATAGLCGRSLGLTRQGVNNWCNAAAVATSDG
jgi:hypothetical protein